MRITQTGSNLLDLLNTVRAGRVVPAAFQRPYVWEREDVLALCESILKGYPIGGFLSWIPDVDLPVDKVGRRRIGPLHSGAPERGIALLLDGQNRLASMAWMMRTEDMQVPADISDAERRVWGEGEQLVVDLAEQCMKFVPAAQAADGFRAPAWVVFGGVTASQAIRHLWNGPWQALDKTLVEAGVRWLDDAQDKFRFARITETTLERATLEEARDAFLHICRVGKPMSQADFEAAVAWVADLSA